MNGVLCISRTHYPVTALGHGRRLGIWTQGCPLGCGGCIAQDTWAPNGGTEVTVAELAEQCRRSMIDGADGVTISGGEPLTQPGPLAELLTAVNRLRAELTALDGSAAGGEYDIMLYTGYDEDELDEAQRAAASMADVIVTGRYVAGAPTTLIWRGSANQRMLLQTPLGRRRYQPYQDYRPESVPMQVRVDDRGVWLVGVPRRGALASIERSLREHGVTIESTTWRPKP